MKKKFDVTIIGHSVVDVLAGPIGENIFVTGSMPMEHISLTYGGNAYNEATVLSRYGMKVDLISKVGKDEAGEKLLDRIRKNGILTDHVICEEGLSTSINIVLYDEKGERRFLTNPKGSQRCISEKDLMDKLDDAADLVCFSCMFVSPLLDVPAMKRIFEQIKKKQDRILAVDMTKAKKGEKIKDLKPLLAYIDYILPNEEELKLLSDGDMEKGAFELLEAGVGCVIVKTGKSGCKVFTKEKQYSVGTYESENPKDTTGAGDCFAAGFLYALNKNMDLQECVRFANATASCCVEKVGATEGVISIDEPMRRYQLLKSFDLE